MKEIIDWSEVWATLIPILILIIKRPKEKYLKPVIIYLLVAVCLNTISDISWKYKSAMPFILQKNNFLYNIHSICRLLIFVVFFKQIDSSTNRLKFDWLMVVAVLLIAVNFIFFGNFFSISSPLFTFEAVILLVLCILYFLRLLRSDKVNDEFDPSLIIITGLAIYESASFFIFLFFDELIIRNAAFAASLWKVHNAFYLIFCIFIARALYGKFNK